MVVIVSRQRGHGRSHTVLSTLTWQTTTKQSLEIHLHTCVHKSNQLEGRKEMFYLTTHSTHFILRIYSVRHMVKDHSDSKRGILFPISYSFRLAARVVLYAPSHRQDSTYHSLCYTSRGALAGTRTNELETDNSL